MIPSEGIEDFIQEARESVLDDLYRGKSVSGHLSRFTLSDIMDCQLDQPYSDGVSILESLASAEYLDLDLHDLQKRAQKLVEDFLDRHPDIVEERAETLANEAEEA